MLAEQRYDAAPSEPSSYLSSDLFSKLFRDLGTCILLSKKEFEVAWQRWRVTGCEKLFDQLVRSQLRWVLKRAQRFAPIFGIPVEDAFQMGCVGLIRAVHKFRPELGFEMSTYATWWIDQQIRRFGPTERQTVRLPAHISERMSHLREGEHLFMQEHGRLPTSSELAHVLCVSEESVRWIQSVREREAKVQSIEALTIHRDAGDAYETVRFERIDGEIDGDGNGHCHDSGRPLDPALTGRIRFLTDRLTPIQKFVCARRILHELYGEPQWTLEQIGERCGMTREGIRQIEIKVRATLQARYYALTGERPLL